MDPSEQNRESLPSGEGGNPRPRIGDDLVVSWLEEAPQPGVFVPQTTGDVVELSSQSQQAVDGKPPRRRRLKLPLSLFLLTCVSTFLAGVASWNPVTLMVMMWHDGLMPLRRMLMTHWQDGLLYMGAALAILLIHEMGHFVATLIHRIPASFPYFLPFPISPLGTLGAVIGMEGSRANRKEIFDIGLAGPIAGLVVAVPMFVLGLQQMDLTQYQFGAFQLDIPLAGRWLMQACQTPGYEPGQMLWQAQLNPLLMAGWVGLFVTGLNMLPVSQLDGGHVIYTLFGRKSHWIARTFILFAIMYMLISKNFGLSVMIGLILFIGTDHPPTRDDSVPLGWFRTILGGLSLVIPLLCFPPRLIVQ
jgi:Zn-dependent protease